MLEVSENRKCKVYDVLKIQYYAFVYDLVIIIQTIRNALQAVGCSWSCLVCFFVFSLFNKPAGMPPYAPQGFPFLPPYPPQETNRTMAAVPVAEAVPSSYTADKPAAPSYGLIADLPLPVPTAEAVLQVCALSFAA